jgi:hypothetical protein
MTRHRFIGDRETPSLQPSFRSGRAVLGTGSVPPQLDALARQRSLFIESKKKPRVDIRSVDDGQELWRVDVPVDAEARGARLGRTMERHPATKFLDEVSEDVSFESYRPEWIDALPFPNLRMDDKNGGEELETENCDLNHGNSGGPIFAWWNNGTDPRLIGVVSSQETEDSPPRNDNVFASGDGFVNLCAWGRTNWPT